jgi:hypothetical protein
VNAAVEGVRERAARDRKRAGKIVAGQGAVAVKCNIRFANGIS